MYTKFFKSNLLVKFINYVVLVSFMCTSVPVRSYAGMFSSDNLRKAAARDGGTDKKIMHMLTEKNREALLSKGMINRLLPLSDALKKIYLSDINSIVARIVPYIPKNIAANELSFMVCNDGLWVLGPEQEVGKQVFIRLSSDFQRSFSSEINKILKEAKAEDIKNGKISVVSVPATEPRARRQMAYYTFSQVISEKKSIADGLTYDHPSYSVAPLMERMIFGAKLEMEFLEGFEKQEKKAMEDYPKLAALINHMKNPESGPYEFIITPELAKKWNLKDGLVKELIKMAPLATAGMRNSQNPLFPGDLSLPMNMLLTLLLTNELAEMSSQIARAQGTISPQAIVGGEVRYNTPLVNEMLRRRFANLGITVHSPPRGVYLPIGATSYITTVLNIMFTIYDTASHSSRGTYASKLMGNLKPPLSPFMEDYLKVLGIDLLEYKKSRSEGAQLLIENMTALAEGVEKKIDRISTGESLVIKFSGGDDKNIRFDIENPSAPGNIDVINRYAKYLKNAYVTENNIKTVQQALNDGLIMGFDQARGSAYKFFRGVYEGVFGKEVVGKINWTGTIPDSFFGDTGMTDFNQKQPPDEFVKRYVKTVLDELDATFSNASFGATFLARISEEDLARSIKEEPRKGKETDIISIRFKIFAKEEEGMLKRLGMPYHKLSSGKILGFYRPKISDISEDVSLLEVVAASKLPSYMLSKPIGYIYPTTDPDGDRFVMMQVEKNDPATKVRLEHLNVAYLVLSDEKLLVVYVPNQNFLQTQNAYIEQLKDENKFSQQIDNPDATIFFAIKTTVSSETWVVLYTSEGIPVVQIPVGFKEIGAVMRKVEFQLMLNKIRKQMGLKTRMVVVHDIFGQAIRLGYNPRLLFGGEESGGMVQGSIELLSTEDKLRSYLSWREKNAVEASVCNTIMICRKFNQAIISALSRGIKKNKVYEDQQFLEDISLSRMLAQLYEQKQMKNTAELRTDVVLVDPLTSSQATKEVRDRMDAEGYYRRDVNSGFFLSLAFSLQKGQVTLKEIKEILKEVLPSDLDMLKKIVSVTDDTAPDILLKQINDLQRYLFVGDAVYLGFSNGAWQVVRPSGTDTKIKSYPSSADPVANAVISNAIGEVYPKIFFELAGGKVVSDMPMTTAYVRRLRDADPDLLNVDAIQKRQQEQYQRGLKVDTMPDWFTDAAIQQFLAERFAEYTKDRQKVSSVHIFLGPVTQEESLRYDSKSNIIYTSWAFDDKMKKAEKKAELFQNAFVLDGGDKKTDEFMPLTPIKLIPGMELKVFKIAGQIYDELSKMSAGFAAAVSKEAWQKIASDIIGNDLVPMLPVVNIDRLYDESVRVAGLIFSEVNVSTHGTVGIDFDVFVKKTGAILARQIELPLVGNRGLYLTTDHDSDRSGAAQISFPNEEKITLALNNLKDTAKKLGVSPKEVMDFLLADSRGFAAVGGETAFVEYLIKAGNEILKAQNSSINNQAALVVHTSFLKKNGALDALNVIAKMNIGVKLGIYGSGAEQIKDTFKNLFFNNDNVVAANTVEELMPKLKKEGVNRQENIVVLKPIQERIDSEIKQVGFSEKTISTVAVAKAVEALSNTENTKAAFEKFYGDLNKEGVISSETYEKTKKDVVADLKEGKLDLPDMPMQKISDTVEKDANSVATFVEKYI